MTDTLLASLADFAAVRGVTYDPTDLAAIISLEASSRAIRTLTGQSFDLVRDDVVRVNGTGSETLLLPQLPVIAVTAVSLHGWSAAEDPTELDPASDWLLEHGPAGIVVRLPAYSCWPRGRANVEVTYDHGYLLPTQTEEPAEGQVAAAPLPADIRAVAMSAAARHYALATEDGRELASESHTIGSYSESKTYAGAGDGDVADLTAFEVGILEAYRIPDPE